MSAFVFLRFGRQSVCRIAHRPTETRVVFRGFKTAPERPAQGRKWKGLLMAVGAGSGIGAYYAVQTNKGNAKQEFNEEKNRLRILPELPDVEISKHVKYANDDSGLDITLFQYPTCPFCCKVRAFLDYNGISYKIVEVNPVLRQQIKWTDYRKVPIVLVKTDAGYLQLNDSSMIISALATYVSDKSSLKEISLCYPMIHYKEPDGTEKSEILNRYFLMNEHLRKDYQKEVFMEERKWRKWADDKLVHVLSPNVYRTPNEALEAFKWFSYVGDWDRHFSSMERQLVIYVGAFAMWMIGKRLKNKHKLKNDVRQSLYDECNVWLTHLRRKKPDVFHGGSRPDLADLAVYGVLSSIEGCEAFQDLLKETKLNFWYFEMKKQVGDQEKQYFSSQLTH